MILLELKQLKKVYDREDLPPFIAADNINLSIKHGDFVSIIGRSGSGKSTLLNMIVGLLRPTSGNILFNGTDLWSMDDKNMAGIRNSQIGYIPQGLSLLSNLTILDNVRLPFFLSQRKGNSIERAMILLEEMGIQNLEKRYPAQLSGGEMRRVAIARAQINNPELLIADEPTSDLDKETTREVMEMFSKICSNGVSILMVTHEIDINSYGNRICIMASGKLTENKTKNDLCPIETEEWL
jgi:ABC-type lipoprotein export system ATPase subunit